MGPPARVDDLEWDGMKSISSASPTTSAVVVTATEPEPRSFGKQVVLGGLLDHLCARLGPASVHVVLIGRTHGDRPSTPYRLHVVDRPSAVEQMAAVALRVVGPSHSSLQEAALWSPRVLSAIRRHLQEIQADLEIWDTIRTGQYARELERKRRVLYADDLFSKRYASMLERIEQDPSTVDNPLGEFHKMLPGVVSRVASRPFVYRRLLQIEKKLTARSENRAPGEFDRTLLVNADETSELIERTGNSTIRTLLPLLREPVGRQRRFDGKPVFVFLGGLDFPPNRDGLAWFLGHCREAVLAAIPDFQLLIVGRASKTALPEAVSWGSHVRTLGWVDDLDDVLVSTAALISPLRIGSGTKIKVLEAISRGLPVVATPHGVLGLDVAGPDGCLIGRTPQELAALVAEAADPGHNQILSAAARSSWLRRFSPAVVSDSYDAALGLPRAAVMVHER